MRPFLIAAFLFLAACGADAPPVPPTEGATMSITGEASVGVSTTIKQ